MFEGGIGIYPSKATWVGILGLLKREHMYSKSHLTFISWENWKMLSWFGIS